MSLRDNEELVQLINSVIDERFKSFSESENLSSNKINLITTKEICAELKISRQTLHNWRKHPKTNDLISPHVSKINKTLLYDLDAIKLKIKHYEFFFGKGNGYPYKYEASATDEIRRDDRFMTVKFRLTNNIEVSADDKLFFLTENKRRDDEILSKCKYP